MSAGQKEALMGAILGDINVDQYGEFPDLPQKGQGMNTDNLQVGLGGAAMNLTQMLKALGAEPYPLASTGRSFPGGIARELMDDLEIERAGIETLPGRSGLFFCAITPDGERTMFGYRGVNREPVNYSRRAERLPEPERWDFLLLSAYLFLHEEQRRQLLSWLRGMESELAGITVGAVISHLFSRRAGIEGELDLQLLDICDVIFLNEDEFTNLTGDLRPDLLREMAECLDLEEVVVSRGGRGSWLYSRQLDEVNEVAGFEIDPLDTTGAGDSLAAGFIWAKERGFDTAEAALMGNFCGAACSLGYGVTAAARSLKKELSPGSALSGKLERSKLQKKLDALAVN